MIPSNFRIKILAIRTLLCAIGTKGLIVSNTAHQLPEALQQKQVWSVSADFLLSSFFFHVNEVTLYSWFSALQKTPAAAQNHFN